VNCLVVNSYKVITNKFEISHFSLGKKNTKSIRTTIPQNVVEELGLNHDGILKWAIVTEKGEKIARVSKLR
jgi:hypothetical protein